MKTKFSRIGKQSISVVLSVLMILSTMVVGSSVTVDTAAIDDLSAVDVVDDVASAVDSSIDIDVSEDIVVEDDDSNVADEDAADVQSNDTKADVAVTSTSKKKSEKIISEASSASDKWYVVGGYDVTSWSNSIDNHSNHELTVDSDNSNLYNFNTGKTVYQLKNGSDNGYFLFAKVSGGTTTYYYSAWEYGNIDNNRYITGDPNDSSNNTNLSTTETLRQFSFKEATKNLESSEIVVFHIKTSGDVPVFYYELVDTDEGENSYEYLRDNPTTLKKRVFLTYKESFTAWDKLTAPWFYGFCTSDGTDTSTTGLWENRPQMTKVTNSSKYGYDYLYYIDVPLATTKFVITGVSGKTISADQQTMDRELGSGNPVLITLYGDNQWSSDDGNKDKRCNLDCTSFDMGTSSERITIFAKNGTIRHSNTGEEYDKFSRMAVTRIYKGTTEGSAYTSKNTSFSLAEVMAVKKGTQVKIETTINKSFTNSTDGYYVAAFIVNGETYSVDKTTKNSDNSVTYTFNYTVPEDSTSEQFKNGYVEITPVYFTNSSNYVTFYVEDFTGQVKSNWKDTIACYAWYSQMSSDDTLDYNSTRKPALGGYPGQPMIKQGDRYYIQVPKSIKEANYSIQGITLNNYIWDDIHALTLGYWTEDQQIDNNYQTYYYDDFVALQETTENGYKNADTIICQFKYRTKIDNFNNTTNLGGFVKNTRSDDTSGYIAHEGVNQPNTSSEYSTVDIDYYANNGNGWDVLTDVNNKPVDIYDNLLNNANSTVTENQETKTFDSISLVNDYTGNKVHIVSDGYEYVEWYIGKYATLWYVYDTNNNFVGALPPSAFLYNVGKNQTLKEVSNASDVPANFLKYSKKAFVGDTPSTASSPKNVAEKLELRKEYWNTFVKIYNANVYGKPTVITYEQEKLGGDNWAYRSDARWLYSVPYVITSNVYIEYGKLNEDGSFDNDTKVRDTYKTDKDGNATNEGSNSGIQAYSTNKKSTDDSGYNLYGKTAVTENDAVTSSGTENFNFTVSDNGFTIHDGTANTDKHYTFIGWYVEKTDEFGNKTYEPVNSGSKLYNEDGSYVMLTDSVFVARYVESDILTVSHKLLSSDTETTKPTTHNGTGEPLVTVKVTTPNGEVVIAENSARDVNINDIQYYYRQYNSASDDDKAKFKLEITLSTTRDEETSVYGVYRKDANSTSTTYYRSGLFNTTEDTENSSATSDDSLNTNGTNNPTGNSEAVVYTYTFDKLFGSLNTNILAYRTDLAKPQTVNLEFKYYDRLLQNNTTARINTEATTLHYTLTDITCYDDLENKIQGVISNPKTKSAEGVYAGAIDNLIDEYAVWPSLKEAVDEKNGYGHWEYGRFGKSYNSLSGYGYDYKDIKLYHTNAYSVPQKSGEKWVTYYKGSGNSKVEIDGIDETNEYKMTVSDVGTVVVWAFNTPKQYNLTVYTDTVKDSDGNFTGATKLAANPVKTYEDDEDGKNSLYAFDVSNPPMYSGYYNQRVGGQDKYGASANKSDTAVDYLLKYFGKESSVGDDGNIAYTGDVVDAPATAQVSDDETTYQFDGWYTRDDDGEYYKVSSDRIYGNRITTSMALYALYKKSPVTLTNNPIVSVTKNGVDIYVDEITDENGNVTSQDQWVRLNTQLNVSYDGATQDNDKKIKRVAVIYVALQSQDFENGTIKSNNIDAIKSWIENNKSSLTVADDGRGTVRKAGKVSFADNTEREIVIMDRFNVGSSETDNTYLSLTSKNRVQFVLPMNYKYYTADSEGKPGAYQYMIAFGAIQYDSDGNDTVSDSDWIISDNYVSFAHD